MTMIEIIVFVVLLGACVFYSWLVLRAKGTKEFYTDTQGGRRWRIRAANGKIVADSAEAYNRWKDCQHGMRVTLLVLLFGRTKMKG